jgi:hypothetical protein
MPTSRRFPRPSPADQPLPFGEDAGPASTAVCGLAGGTDGSEPDTRAQHLVDPEPAAAAEGKTHCPAGHPYDAGNTYVSRQGWRSCRTCKRLSDRRRRDRTAKNLSPEERILRARMGAYRLHALYDPKETTKKARAAFAARFDRQVDPDGLLSPADRARRADAARRAYFSELQLRSSRARRTG